jgi:hypothetical protein
LGKVYLVKSIKTKDTEKTIALESADSGSFIFYTRKLHPAIVKIFEDLKVSEGQTVEIIYTEKGLKVKLIC